MQEIRDIQKARFERRELLNMGLVGGSASLLAMDGMARSVLCESRRKGAGQRLAALSKSFRRLLTADARFILLPRRRLPLRSAGPRSGRCGTHSLGPLFAPLVLLLPVALLAACSSPVPTSTAPASSRQGLSSTAQTADALPPAEGREAPDFSLEGLSGGALRLSDLRGRAVILNFWASWCHPCARELPDLADVYARYREQGLQVVAVNLRDRPAVVADFVTRAGLDLPVALDRTGDVAERYKLIGLPATFFIDRRGIVRSVQLGAFASDESGRAMSELDDRVQAILSEGGGRPDGS